MRMRATMAPGRQAVNPAARRRHDLVIRRATTGHPSLQPASSVADDELVLGSRPSEETATFSGHRDAARPGDTRRPTMSAQTDPLYLPLVVIDISSLRSDRRRHAPIDENEVVAPRRSRRSRLVAAAKTNI